MQGLGDAQKSTTFIPICPYSIYSPHNYAMGNYMCIILCSVACFWIGVAVFEIFCLVCCTCCCHFCVAASSVQLVLGLRGWRYPPDNRSAPLKGCSSGSHPRIPKTTLTWARHPHVTTAWINITRWSKNNQFTCSNSSTQNPKNTHLHSFPTHVTRNKQPKAAFAKKTP